MATHRDPDVGFGPMFDRLDKNRKCAAAQATTESPSDRYIRKMDAALAEMAPAERLPALRRERVRWIGLSEEFARRIDGGQEPKPGETAFDYEIVIATLAQRIATQEQRQ